jgi:hypothetical protein
MKPLNKRQPNKGNNAMIIKDFEEFEYEPQPFQIHPVAIDLGVAEASDGKQQVIMRVIDAETGARIDVVIPSRKLASDFGLSLQEFASTVLL